MLAGTRVAGDGLIEIGDNVFINADCYFDAAANIEIGTGVRIADHVRLITSSHQVGLKSRRAGEGLAKPIHIGEGAWIGSSSLILPGVTVASGCIIGAGSVVAKSTDSDGLYLGVPARRVRDLSE
jgi:acetyltransferase-like isoleucine patch superfamily enzyme